MEQSVIYALDFDGVICDSAVETGISGWKAAASIWNDMKTSMPEQRLVDQFRLARPVLETGYESIFVMRMLFNGDSLTSILKNFHEKKQHILQKIDHSTDSLKLLFGETRDTWINDSKDEWLTMNPLFNHVRERLNQLSKHHRWYIVTTKQERFVSQILNANQIELPEEFIFGLEKKKSKEAILITLQKTHPGQTIYFVEDRLPPLLDVLKSRQLHNIKLFFATWGYNTQEDKLEAANNPIKLIELDEFLT